MNTVKFRFLFMFLLLFGVWHVSLAQEEMKISGVVTDTKSAPLAGVTITVKETSQATVTDFEGRYEIIIAKGQTLVFTAEGKKPQEVVPTSGVVDVKLEGVNEVVDQQKKEPSAPMNTNPRGQASISKEAKPLWVLNGVILQEDISLKPEELVSDDAKMLIAAAIPGLSAESIESFKVLKDASATAIYGPRAIAGVVVITTKSGAAGSSSITYTNESTFRFIPTYGEFNIMNSQDHMSLMKELYEGAYFLDGNTVTSATSGLMAKMNQLYKVLDANGNPRVSNTPEGRLRYMRMAERRNTNWFKELFQTSIMQNHTLSFSSGSEKSTYYASLSILDDPGWTKGSKLSQYSGNLNATYNLSSKIGLNVITDLSYKDQTDPYRNLYYYAQDRSRTLDPKEYYVERYTPFNIFNEIDNSYIDKDIATVRLQGQLTWKISPKVEATAMGAIRYQSYKIVTDHTEYSNRAISYRYMPNSEIRNANTYLYKDPNDPFAQPIPTLPKGGIRTQTLSTSQGTTFRATLSYIDSFMDGLHALSLYGGFEMDNNKNTYDSSDNYGVNFGSGYYSAFSYIKFKKMQEEGDDYYTISPTTNNYQDFYANVNYTFKDRYTFNGTLRYDASNQFGKSRYVRWMPTWNAGLSWDVSQESFFKYLPLSYLTFSGSFGVTAIAPSVSNSLSQIYTNQPWRNSNNRELGLNITNGANHDLTYEKNQELDLGVQFGILNSRLNFSVDWFNRKSYDLIGNIDTQGVGGTIAKQGNMAEMKSHGLELAIESTNIKTENFTWKTSFVYSRSTNEITKLLTSPNIQNMVGYNEDATTVGGFAKEGYPLKSLFSIPFRGLDERGFPTFTGPNGELNREGFNMQDSNVDFLKYSGTLIPTDRGSFTNTINYKGISFGVVITYSYGNVVRLRRISDALTYNDYASAPRELNSRWRIPGDEARTNIPKAYSIADVLHYSVPQLGVDLSQPYSSYDYSDVRIAKGDNIRLKEISLGYTFDNQFLKETRIRHLSLKLQATNLALLYADKKLNGDDPDFLANGYAQRAPKQLIFTLRIGL